MITVLMDDCNGFSQDLYKNLIDSLQLHLIECTCGKKGCLIFFGHYRRSVKYLSHTIHLHIQRVCCKECGKTNALLPSLLVPYSQIPLRDQQELLHAINSGSSPEPVMERNNLIDENHVKYIFSQFKKHWKQRLLSLGVSLLEDLTPPCLAAFSRQFMQIHRTRNKLCPFTNTPLPDTSSRIPYDEEKHIRRIHYDTGRCI